jgi:Dolichyl-phosphate-mannose-protein mannosyltransferase
LFLLHVLGGFASPDSFESAFTTWAIAEGHASCAYPRGFNLTAPLYPLVSAGVVAFEHVTRGTPLPPATQGSCSQGFVAMNAWSLRSDALGPILQVGVVGWLALMSGSVALLRACGRGRRRWEPATVILLACLPPVLACVQSTFHPEDLLAVGLVLGAVACACRSSDQGTGREWILAGVLVGLAVQTQQFAVLVAVPLFFVAPRTRRSSFVLAAMVTVAAVAVPMLMVTSGSALHAVLFGTGNSYGIGGALVSYLHLHGARVVVVSRLLPLALSGYAAWWMARRLGSQVRTPVVVLSLVAFSLGLRLLFELQLFAYYFMALTVALVLLDVVRGRLRGSLVAWLCAVPVVFVNQLDILGERADLVRVGCVLASAGAILVLFHTRRAPWTHVAPWVGVIACTVASGLTMGPLGPSPMWVWQSVLVCWGLALSVPPALTVLREHSVAGTFANPDAMTTAPRSSQLINEGSPA